MAKDEEKNVPIILDRGIKNCGCAGSCLITDKPCWLYSVIFCSWSVGANLFNLRDGELVTSPIKMGCSLLTYTTVPIVFKYPVRFTKGLYLEFQTAGLYVFIQYKEDY